MAGATMVQQPTNNALKQLFQDLNKVMVSTDRLRLYRYHRADLYNIFWIVCQTIKGKRTE